MNPKGRGWAARGALAALGTKTKRSGAQVAAVLGWSKLGAGSTDVARMKEPRSSDHMSVAGFGFVMSSRIGGSSIFRGWAEQSVAADRRENAVPAERKRWALIGRDHMKNLRRILGTLLLLVVVGSAQAADLRVMKTGLGKGWIDGPGISCGITATNPATDTDTLATDCNETSTTSIT